MLLGVNTLMLLKVLRALERLATDIAIVRLERGVNSDVRSDVVTLGTADITSIPFASQAEVVRGLATDVIITQMLVDNFWVLENKSASVPETGDGMRLAGLQRHVQKR